VVKIYLVQVEKDRGGKHLRVRPAAGLLELALKRDVQALPVGAKLTVTIELDDPNVVTSS